jgi:hypothetical protein
VTENREHAPAISSASCACISFSPMIPMGTMAVLYFRDGLVG